MILRLKWTGSSSTRFSYNLKHMAIEAPFDSSTRESGTLKRRISSLQRKMRIYFYHYRQIKFHTEVSDVFMWHNICIDIHFGINFGGYVYNMSLSLFEIISLDQLIPKQISGIFSFNAIIEYDSVFLILQFFGFSFWFQLGFHLRNAKCNGNG